MANIKSAKKRILIAERNQMRNKAVRSATKTAVKRLQSAVAAGDKDAIAVAHLNAVRAIDKATTKGVYHKNNASRKKSQFAKLVNNG